MKQFFFIGTFLILTLLMVNTLFATTTIDTTGLPVGFDFPDTTTLTTSFQDVCDKNGPGFANAYAFSSTLGYAIGKSTLGDFPSFEFGTTINAGLTNTSNFQHSKTGIYNGTLPGIGVAPVFHAGVGFGGGMDFILKFMSYNQDIYRIPSPGTFFTLEKLSLYMIGGRLRYNYIKEKPIIPFLLSFGGVTFSAGGDLMRGIIGMSGDYSLSLPSVSLTIPTSPPNITVTPSFDGTYETQLAWYQLSCSVQALSYFNMFKIFSLYTGFGLSLGYGWYTFEFNAPGTLTDTSGTLAPANGGSDVIGDVLFESKSKYHPMSILPTYVIGLEINFFLVKLVAESQVNLRNREDVSVSLGLRAQF